MATVIDDVLIRYTLLDPGISPLCHHHPFMISCRLMMTPGTCSVRMRGIRIAVSVLEIYNEQIRDLLAQPAGGQAAAKK